MYEPTHYHKGEQFPVGTVLCNKYATPNPENCFLVKSPYYYGRKCTYYFYVTNLANTYRKSLTDITAPAHADVTTIMLEQYPEYFI